MGRELHGVKMTYSHNSKTAKNEPPWGSVDKSKLPFEAFAFYKENGKTQPDKDKKSTWSYPHHFIRNGKMYLHRGGLNAAWAAAMGARTGKKAKKGIIDHLQEHRRALKLADEELSEAIQDIMHEQGVTWDEAERVLYERDPELFYNYLEV